MSLQNPLSLLLRNYDRGSLPMDKGIVVYRYGLTTTLLPMAVERLPSHVKLLFVQCSHVSWIPSSLCYLQYTKRRKQEHIQTHKVFIRCEGNEILTGTLELKKTWTIFYFML